MGGMKHLYDEGKVAIVQGVGYDQPSFSHFTSMSFWHTAAPNSGNEYGWIGRTAVGARPRRRAREHDREHLRQPDAGGEGREARAAGVHRSRRGSSAACSRRRRPVARRARRGSTTPVGDAHKYVLEVTQSAAQASEVVRAAWSQLQGQGQSGSAAARSRQGGGAHRSRLPDAALLRAAAQQPVRHAREPGGAARSAARLLLGRHRRLLPGDEAHRPRRRRRDVRPQRVRPPRAREHQPRHRPRHGAGELRDRQRA